MKIEIVHPDRPADTYATGSTYPTGGSNDPYPSPGEGPVVIDEEVLAPVNVPRRDQTIRNVVLEGLRTEQLAFSHGAAVLSAVASPIYLGQLAAAVQAPIVLTPALPPKSLSDTIAYQDNVLPTLIAYLKELEAATNAIEKKRVGLENVLGQPVGDVTFGGKDYEVAYRRFEHGAIYLAPGGRAVEVHGAIYQKYLALGAENSFLGFPETDELSTTLGTGRFNHFHGGSIYWTAQGGAWSIHGVIRDRWLTLDAERGYLGFPISDVEHGQISHFERGQLRFMSNGSVEDFPDSVILKTSVNGGNVKCTAEFWMNSKGAWHYEGHLHNDGFAGCTASVTATPRFQAADGHVFVVSAERSLGGTMDTEERNDDWDQTGDDGFIAANWDIIRSAGLSVVLKTNTQIGDVLNIIWPFVALAVIIFGGASKGSKLCGPYGSIKRDINGNDNPSVGFQLVGEGEPCPGGNGQDLFEIQK